MADFIGKKDEEQLSFSQLQQRLKKLLNRKTVWLNSEQKLAKQMAKVRQQRFRQSLLPSPLFTKNFIVIGAPGAGKGTLAEVLKKELGILSISTGEIFRAQQEIGSPLGLKIKETLLAGRLISDDIVNEIVRQALLNIIQTGSGFILDGYPRNANQMAYLDTKIGPLIDAIFYLKITPEQAYQRILNRRICSDCQRSYNYNFNIPINTRVCPICSGKLVKRGDDNPEVIRERIVIFEQQTAPLLDFYTKQGKLVTFDATTHPQEIAKIIRERYYQIWEGKEKEDLRKWDTKKQEAFLTSMLRLSRPEPNYCLDRRECRSEYARLKELYPWELPESGSKNNKQASPEEELKRYAPQVDPNYNRFLEVLDQTKEDNTSFPLEEELRKIHQRMLDRLVRSKEAKTNQSLIIEETEQADEIFDILHSIEGEEDLNLEEIQSGKKSSYSKWLKDYLAKKENDWDLTEPEGESEEEGTTQADTTNPKSEKVTTNLKKSLFDIDEDGEED